jgi:hypothetical protein
MVKHVPAEGGPPTVVVREEHDNFPMALALDGNRLVFPATNAGFIHAVTLQEGKLVSCGAEGAEGLPLNPECLRVAQAQGSLLLENIVAQRGYVLFADGEALKKSTATIDRLAYGAIAATNRGPISSFAATATHVYFAEGSTLDTKQTDIYKAVISEVLFEELQPAISIARGQRDPRSVIVDDERVYWSTADCAIMATPR